MDTSRVMDAVIAQIGPGNELIFKHELDVLGRGFVGRVVARLHRRVGPGRDVEGLGHRFEEG